MSTDEIRACLSRTAAVPAAAAVLVAAPAPNTCYCCDLNLLQTALLILLLPLQPLQPLLRLLVTLLLRMHFSHRTLLHPAAQLAL
jgi:hypothetical protein